MVHYADGTMSWKYVLDGEEMEEVEVMVERVDDPYVWFAQRMMEYARYDALRWR